MSVRPNGVGAAPQAGGDVSAGLSASGIAAAGELDVEVTLAVEPGETLAVLGPNGAGKSTLLRAVAGLQPLRSGVVALDGRILEDTAAGVRVRAEDRSIGVVFQELLLFPHLDVRANVAFGLEAQGMRRADAREAAAEWLDRLGLGALAHARPDHLSGGEAQRVALARALAARPRALLLDEPLSALDVDARGAVRRTLREHLALHTGPRVVVTHDPFDAAVLADRIVVMEDGRITASGTLEELVARPRSAWAAELAGTNLLPATAAGACCTVAGGGQVVVADPPGDGPVLVAVRPAAVALHLAHPEGSPRNVWPATVVEVEGYGERVRVRLDGSVAMVAEVTTAAVQELGIRPGLQLWASVKATDIAAYPA